MKEDYSGAQAATVETKPGKKKLKKIKKEEREKTKGLSVTQLAFSHLFWIRIRIDLALLNPDPHHNMVSDLDSEAINFAKMDTGDTGLDSSFFKNIFVGTLGKNMF